MNADAAKCICQGRGVYFVMAAAEGASVYFDGCTAVAEATRTVEVPCRFHSRQRLTDADRDMLKEAGIS